MKLKPLIKYNEHNLLNHQPTNTNNNEANKLRTTPSFVNANNASTKSTTPLGFTNHSSKYNDK